MRSPARIVLVLLLTAVAFTSGCTELARIAITASGAARSEGEASEPIDPNVTATLASYQGSDGLRNLHVMADVSHPYDYTVEGIQVRWKMHDDTGKLVASNTFRVPPVPPGVTVPVIDHDYSPMSRNRPNRPTLEVVSSGRRSDVAPRQFSVGDVTFERVVTTSACGYRQSNTCTTVSYTATVTVTTDDRPVDSDDVYVGLIAKDKDGKAIGIDVTQPGHQPTVGADVKQPGYPQSIDPGTPLRIVKKGFFVNGEAASVEAFVHVIEA
jgi:hypothetical protein